MPKVALAAETQLPVVWLQSPHPGPPLPVAALTLAVEDLWQFSGLGNDVRRCFEKDV